MLLEANVSGETSKGGFSPSELLAAWDDLRALAGPQLAGLMTMAPFSDDPDVVRPVFRKLRELRDQLANSGESSQVGFAEGFDEANHIHGKVRLEDSANPTGSELVLPELSMGMSGDFEIAVEEGATMVRIGTRLFEEG